MTPFHPDRTLAAALAGLLISSPAFAAAGTPHPQQGDTQPPAPVVRIVRPAPKQAGQAGQTNPAPSTPAPTPHRPRQTPDGTGSVPPTPSATAPQTLPTTATPARHAPPAQTGTASQALPAVRRPASPARPPASEAAPGTSETSPARPSETSPARPAAAEPAPEHKPSNIINGLNRNVIVLDPGHGGSDAGARIGEGTPEKNVTLALAFRLRSLLLARGFTVVLTRDSDAAALQTSPTAAPTPLTLDDRAGIANHAHAAACLLLHATGRGTGLHLYSSELTSAAMEPALPAWLTAQAAWVPASRALQGALSAALGRSGVPVVQSAASVRPLDSLACPALVVELAPEGSSPNSINNAGYDERVASALAGALVFWASTVQPPPHGSLPPRPPHHHPAGSLESAAAEPAARGDQP